MVKFSGKSFVVKVFSLCFVEYARFFLITAGYGESQTQEKDEILSNVPNGLLQEQEISIGHLSHQQYIQVEHIKEREDSCGEHQPISRDAVIGELSLEPLYTVGSLDIREIEHNQLICNDDFIYSNEFRSLLFQYRQRKLRKNLNSWIVK